MTIAIRKYGHDGAFKWAYTGEEVARGDDWICIEAFFNGREADDGYIVWQHGDRFLEWFYADRGYNVFKIFDRDTDAVKGWYCNITRPARLLDDAIEWSDLALDVFIPPTGEILILDEDEFTALPLTDEERAEALANAERIRTAVAAGEAPFQRP